VRVRQSRARGQHFLRSSALAQDIVRSAGVLPGELVVDIGAGTGVLTSALARAGADVVAVELDPVLAARLRARFPRVVEDDARQVVLPAEPFRVVANLPFEGATEILRRVLERPQLESADVILQWEVAAKRAGVWPSTALGVIWSASYELSVVRRLPREAFAPPPAVDVGLLRATRRAEPLVATTELRRYARFVRAGFRDGIRSVAPPLTQKRLARELGFPQRGRPCDLDARAWAELFRAVRRTR
jgi:16S rRNA A1518/A1519 N6-dimethyltransferase RsmA/KsgA/DIM1 with predicted DNA glycosylase/AP lyase activity